MIYVLDTDVLSLLARKIEGLRIEDWSIEAGQ
jgi:hypothetical protein